MYRTETNATSAKKIESLLPFSPRQDRVAAVDRAAARSPLESRDGAIARASRGRGEGRFVAARDELTKTERGEGEREGRV